MTRHRLAPTVAAVVAAAAIGAPTAIAVPADSTAPEADHAAPTEQPSGPDLRSPDARDFAEGRSITASTPVVIERTRTAPRGFDWSDAAIGSAGTIGVVLLVAGGTMLVGRRRREPADLLPAA